jgi:hypothetical protein
MRNLLEKVRKSQLPRNSSSHQQNRVNLLRKAKRTEMQSLSLPPYLLLKSLRDMFRSPIQRRISRAEFQVRNTKRSSTSRMNSLLLRRTMLRYISSQAESCTVLERVSLKAISRKHGSKTPQAFLILVSERTWYRLFT